MASRMPLIGGVYIQMEDEIASLAAVLGASWAGVKAMTATSGPGFSLMMENYGLAIMTETPCVIVNVQRGGPSTGLPTLVGQQDIMQARWGTHGDIETIALCPESPQEAFDLTIKAFNFSEKYRTPVLLMTDEGVGHLTEKVIIPKPEDIEIVNRKKPTTPPEEYKTYQPDDDLVPPMAVAGEGYHIFMEGLTHDEHGYPVIDADAQYALVKRLCDKIRRYRNEIIMVEEIMLDDADIVVVAYGITSRVARRVVNMARREGIKAGLLRLITIWPIPKRELRKCAERAKAFVVPEINMGQIRREVERFVDRNTPVASIPNPGGRIHTPNEILQWIRRLA